ncbi:hypothetical protein [Phenylobacterium sp.]|uniref:hypothetical protein n=1 Tax=Phenylobacterium sp. TaxID=1871053 RepID=UPI0025E35E28|nr:hypothetical protein [Phenylobacterium sp.]
MSDRLNRFLTHTTVISRKAALGRVVNVTRETWRLSDDPQAVRPEVLSLVIGLTASEAADLAREAAEAMPRHGFHKPSSSWWGADETQFHRFVVHTGPRHKRTGLLIASGLLGLAVAALVRRQGRGRAKDKR